LGVFSTVDSVILLCMFKVCTLAYPYHLHRRHKLVPRSSDPRERLQDVHLGKPPPRSAGDSWALSALAADGEAPLGAIKLPQYLAAAAAVFSVATGVTLLHATAASAPQAADLSSNAPVTTVGACAGDAALQTQLQAAERFEPGLCAWAARVVVAQQRMLAKPALSLLRALVQLHAAADAVPLPPFTALAAAQTPHGPNENNGNAAVTVLDHPFPIVANGKDDDVRARALDVQAQLLAARRIEACLAWHLYGYQTESAKALQAASEALGMQVATGGALGKRTEAQENATAQLVLQVTIC
jgi:hypothetical protein